MSTRRWPLRNRQGDRIDLVTCSARKTANEHRRVSKAIIGIQNAYNVGALLERTQNFPPGTRKAEAIRVENVQSTLVHIYGIYSSSIRRLKTIPLRWSSSCIMMYADVVHEAMKHVATSIRILLFIRYHAYIRIWRIPLNDGAVSKTVIKWRNNVRNSTFHHHTNYQACPGLPVKKSIALNGGQGVVPNEIILAPALTTMIKKKGLSSLFRRDWSIGTPTTASKGR